MTKSLQPKRLWAKKNWGDCVEAYIRKCVNARTLPWRYNERDGVSNHQPHDCLHNCSFRCTSKKTSKLHITGLCEENSPVTSDFPAQRASNAENVSIWWRHHDFPKWTYMWRVIFRESDIFFKLYKYLGGKWYSWNHSNFVFRLWVM